MKLDHDLDTHLESIVAGDSTALGRWIVETENHLREELRGFAPHVDLEPILQETYLRIWQIAPRIERDKKPNVLYRTTRRLAVRLAAAELSTRPEGGPIAEAIRREIDRNDAFAGHMHWSSQRPLLEACRKQLPPRAELALTERLASGGVDPDEVLAARTGMRLRTFLSAFAEARTMLADCVKRRSATLDPNADA